MTKVCHKCNGEFPKTEEYFGINKAYKDGFLTMCKRCRSVYANEWYSRHKEQYLAYRERNSEWINNNKKMYRQNNKEKIYKERKKYRQKYKEQIYINNKKYLAKHPEKYIISRQKRKARFKQLPATLTTEEWASIKESFNCKCAYCGKKNKLHQDHFVPLSKGGEYTHNNIIPACGRCNCSKNDSDFFEWYSRQDYYSKTRERNLLKFLNYNIKNQVQQLTLTL